MHMFVLDRDVRVPALPQQRCKQSCPTPQTHQVVGPTDGISYCVSHPFDRRGQKQGRAFVREISRLELFSWEARWPGEDFKNTCKSRKSMKNTNKQGEKYKLPKINQRSSFPQEARKGKKLAWIQKLTGWNKGLLNTEPLSYWGVGEYSREVSLCTCLALIFFSGHLLLHSAKEKVLGPLGWSDLAVFMH